mgnify:CR=1 FL=1
MHVFDRSYHAVDATNTPGAPWHVVPADHRWYTQVAAADIVRDTLEALAPQHPPLSCEELEKAGLSRSGVPG